MGPRDALRLCKDAARVLGVIGGLGEFEEAMSDSEWIPVCRRLADSVDFWGSWADSELTECLGYLGWSLLLVFIPVLHVSSRAKLVHCGSDRRVPAKAQ